MGVIFENLTSNRLHNCYKTFKTSGNRLQVLCNQLQALNFKFKICKFVSEMNLATGNRLHPLIINYPARRHHVPQILQLFLCKHALGNLERKFPFHENLKSCLQVKKMIMYGPAVYQDIVKEDDDILPEVWLK